MSEILTHWKQMRSLCAELAHQTEGTRTGWAAKEAVEKADALRPDVERLLRDNAALRKALEAYKYCRHGCIACRCTTEARAALFADPEGGE